MQWSADSKEVAFVSTSRDHKREDMRIADAGTGAVTNVLSERAETFFESGQGRVNWRYLPQTKEVLWFSRKDDWGHLYLHDCRHRDCRRTASRPATATSRRCCASTKPAARSTSRASGRKAGRDPYFRQLYKIGFDGKGQTLLTPEDGDHTVDLSPSGKYFVDTLLEA